MRRNLYITAFIAVLLIACVGGFVGGRVLLQRLQGDFTSRNGPTAQPTALAAPTEQAVAQVPTQPASSAPAATAPRATSTVLVVPAPVTDQPAVLTPEPTWTAGIELPTLEPGQPTPEPGASEGTPSAEGTTTPEPSATPLSDFPYVLARPVRYTSGDCPGSYALGTVTDRSGNPLAGIHLSLVDEYGNAFSAVTKQGPGDTGHYDFPMSGPPRRFYMTVVDEAGRPQSQRIEILHDVAPYQGKGCRWVDWRRS